MPPSTDDEDLRWYVVFRPPLTPRKLAGPFATERDALYFVGDTPPAWDPHVVKEVARD